MTIKTLSYIHNLLQENAEAKEDTKKYLYERWQKAVDENSPQEENLRLSYNFVKDEYYDAIHALEEFEAKEW